MLNLILLGPPGSGKGTQAERISSAYNLPHISTGNIFREAYERKTELGIRAKEEYWGEGFLVPDDITNQLAFERLQQEDCAKGFILDGYPRTIPQAEALERFLAGQFSGRQPPELSGKRLQEQPSDGGWEAAGKGKQEIRGQGIDLALYFSCREETLVSRAAARRMCRGCKAIYGLARMPAQPGRCEDCHGELYRRDDDSPAVVRERLGEYQRKTAPLLEFYRLRGLVKEVDAERSADDVFREVLEKLSKG